MEHSAGHTAVVSSDVVKSRLWRPEIIDQDLASRCSHAQCHSILLEVSAGQGMLALDLQDRLLGLDVAAHQVLVQTHGQGKIFIDW